jgi:uncharacterized protein DUF1707
MCHARHARYAHREWPRAADPEPPSGAVRAGDADRERAAEALRTHAGAGRLDADELERRLETVLSATYLSELDAALADLPRLRAGERPRTGRRERSAGPSVSRTATLLGAVAALLVVTMLTGLWALWWLMWPIAILTHPRGSCGRRPRASSRTASV